MLSIKKKKGRMMVNPSQLIENPLNTTIYTNKEEEQKTREKIAESYKIRIEQGLCPNEQPIMIWEDGMVDAGNTRKAAGIIAKCDVWVEYTDKPYPDFKNTPYDTLEAVRSSNIYRKMTPSVKMNEFIQMNKAYVTQHNMARTTTQENIHLKELGISRDTMKKLIEINEKMPELLAKVDATELSIKAAHDEATGKNQTKVVKSNNPNRDWSPIYTDEFFKTTMNRVCNTINSTLESKVVINGEDYFPFKDFTKGSIAGIISHLMETIGSEVLKSEGHNVKPASGHPTDPDIYHIDIDDKVEIKVTNFNGSSTSWKGGMGIREGQYILATYDEQIERWLVIFTKLTAEDWKSAGIGGHTLPIKNVLENHENDMVIFCGSLYWNGDKVQAQLDNL
jgi:hypothetical protein